MHGRLSTLTTPQDVHGRIARRPCCSAVLLAAILSAAILGGCGNGQRPVVSEPPATVLSSAAAATQGPFPVPSPAQAARQLGLAKRVSSLVEHDGSDFEAGFAQRAAAQPPSVSFTPGWTDGSNAFDAVAWAMYRFDVSGRSGRPVVKTTWSHAPGDFTHLWIGVSNWARDRWDWYNGEQAGSVQLPADALDIYQHQQTHELYTVVLLTGQVSSKMSRIQLTSFSKHGDWWAFGRTARHGSASPFTGPGSPALMWQLPLGKGSGSNPPVYDASGRIFIGAVNTAMGSSTISALNADGTAAWTHILNTVAGGPVIGPHPSPVVHDNGYIYYAVPGGAIHVFDPGTGLEQWNYAGHLSVFNHPAIGPNGTAIVCGAGVDGETTSYYLYALGTSGALLWEKDLGTAACPSSPVLDEDGNIYIAVNDTVYGYDSGGTQNWSTALGSGGQLAELYLGQDQLLYAGGRSPALYALHTDGTLQRTVVLPAALNPALACGPDGALYAPCADGRLYALNSDDSIRWAFDVCGAGYPTVDGSGRVYIGSSDTRLYALNPDGSLDWWFAATDGINAGPVVAEDGTLYFEDADGVLYAMGPGISAEKYTVSGYIWDDMGQGLPDTTVYLTGAEPVVTDAGGYWFKSGLADGAYAVSPVKDGYRFTPQLLEFTIDGADFAADNIYGEALGEASWPVEGLNTAHTRRSPYQGPAGATLKWSVRTAIGVQAEPILGTDGMVYVQGMLDGLYAVNPDGTVAWNTYLGSWPNAALKSAPALGADGVLFVNSANGLLRAFSPAGTFIWSRSTAMPAGSPLLSASNTLLQTTQAAGINALTPGGSLQWSYTAPAAMQTLVSAAIAADGTIYIAQYSDEGPDSSRLTALNADGTLQWEAALASPAAAPESTPAIADDGTVYVGFGPNLYAINADGSQKWVYAAAESANDKVKFAPAVAADGTVYFVKGDDDDPATAKLVALGADGLPAGVYQDSGVLFNASPTLDAAGAVYIATVNPSEFRALDASLSLVWSYATTGKPQACSIGPDGTLYGCDNIGYLYAIGD